MEERMVGSVINVNLSTTNEILTGLLCSLDPLNTHIVLLRLESTTQDQHLQQQKVTMLHRESFTTVEVADPIPLEWVAYLKKHQEKSHIQTTSTENISGQDDQNKIVKIQRMNHTISVLKKNGMKSKISKDGNSIVALGGALSIVEPFDATGCTSSNPLILRRMINLLST